MRQLCEIHFILQKFFTTVFFLYFLILRKQNALFQNIWISVMKVISLATYRRKISRQFMRVLVEVKASMICFLRLSDSIR